MSIKTSLSKLINPKIQGHQVLIIQMYKLDQDNFRKIIPILSETMMMSELTEKKKTHNIILNQELIESVKSMKTILLDKKQTFYRQNMMIKFLSVQKKDSKECSKFKKLENLLLKAEKKLFKILLKNDYKNQIKDYKQDQINKHLV